MTKFFRVVWGIATLLALVWMIYGISTTAIVTSDQLDTVSARGSEAYQAGTLIGSGLGLSFFLCTGLPFLLLFGVLYWRNGVAIREAKRHEETISALRGR